MTFRSKSAPSQLHADNNSMERRQKQILAKKCHRFVYYNRIIFFSLFFYSKIVTITFRYNLKKLQFVNILDWDKNKKSVRFIFTAIFILMLNVQFSRRSDGVERCIVCIRYRRLCTCVCMYACLSGNVIKNKRLDLEAPILAPVCTLTK